MTREEAIEELKTRYLTMSQRLDIEELHKANKAIDMAITALSQEEQSEWERDHEVLKAYADGQESMKPCKDAISRQAAIDAIEELKKVHFDRVVVLNKVKDSIGNLPPVSVAEKVGEWEMCEDADGLYGICSVCGVDADFRHYGIAYKWCPNCGAKMVEREDKE